MADVSFQVSCVPSQIERGQGPPSRPEGFLKLSNEVADQHIQTLPEPHFLTLSPARLTLAVFQILAFLLTNTQEEAVSGVAVPAVRKESRRHGCAKKDHSGWCWKCGRDRGS